MSILMQLKRHVVICLPNENLLPNLATSGFEIDRGSYRKIIIHFDFVYILCRNRAMVVLDNIGSFCVWNSWNPYLFQSPWNQNSNDALQFSQNTADFMGISLEIHHKVILDCMRCVCSDAGRRVVPIEMLFICCIFHSHSIHRVCSLFRAFIESNICILFCIWDASYASAAKILLQSANLFAITTTTPLGGTNTKMREFSFVGIHFVATAVSIYFRINILWSCPETTQTFIN